MSPFLAEVVGTAILVTLGDGVVANVVLKHTKGNAGGWIVITFGWAIAVFAGAFTVAGISGAHLNPAVTLGLALTGAFDWAQVPAYILAQFIGSFIGATLVWISYRDHFNSTESAADKLAVFCNMPAIRSPLNNLFTEVIGTFILILGILLMTKPEMKMGSIDALPVALLVLGIGLSLGGPTGYAINPARDLGPRIMHAILPIKGKGGSGWDYAWIPVVGPLLGAALAAIFFNLVH
jgi:glycerol uptake facilitator protein